MVQQRFILAFLCCVLWHAVFTAGARADFVSPSGVSGKGAQLWSFQKPKPQPVPAVADASWPKDPIDNFVLRRLEERQLKHAPTAGKAELLRRASFDLTGLPPKPEDLQAFLADESAEAFAKVIDKLLDTPEFGERWGRHWLDVVRYADSNGLDGNQPYPNAWRYRDYVISAINKDTPYNQFIREQLAGDLLPFKSDEERYEQLTATGFLAIGPKALFENREKLVMDVADEQIDVTSRAFLGLTVSCARCHDHKYDPIPTRDYYAMAGIFTSTASLSTGDRRMPGMRWVERPLASAEKARAIEEYDKTMDTMSQELKRAQETPGGLQSSKLPGIVVDNTQAQLKGRWKESIGTASGFVDKNYQHDAKSDKGMMTARFVPRLPHTGQYEVLVSYIPRSDRATNVPVSIQCTNGTTKVFVNQARPPVYKNAFVSVGNYPFEAGTNGVVVISNENTKGYVTIDAVMFVPIDEWKLEQAQEDEARMMAMAPQMQKNAVQEGMAVSVAMNQSMGMQPESYSEVLSKMLKLQEEAPPPADSAMAVEEGTVGDSRINIRGDFEKLGPEVPRGFLSVISGKNATLHNKNSSGRLELAEWIVSQENPLTARVAVNRIWQHLFGRGLVDTPDNFGTLSETPANPELLDYLALRFAENGWSLKKTIRQIMLSRTYQMSCGYDSDSYAKDPDNRYVWRMNRRRLEAEAVRDSILSISGQLDTKRGGPVDPPAGGMNLGDDQSENRRRAVYLPIVRNNVPDMLQAFDFADPNAVTAKRHTTTTATQALFLMNSKFVADQSRKWAESLLAMNVADDAARLERAYEQAIGRTASKPEIERSLVYLKTFMSAEQDGKADKKVLAWESLCQALFSSTEFRFLD